MDLETNEARADLLQLMGGFGHLGVHAVWFEIVRQNALPVGLLIAGDRRPMPVLDHVGAAGEIGVDIFTKLAIVGRKLTAGGPADGLGVRFGNEEVGVLE